MSKYKIRPGIVLISICDEHILVATREARDICPYVQQINNAAAYYWELLQSGTDMKDMVDKAADHFNMPKIKALINLDVFIKKLVNLGYVIEED